MLPASILNRLIAHVSPAILQLLSLPGAAGLPPLAAGDEASVRVWLERLSPAELKQFLLSLPLGAEIVAMALLELNRVPSVATDPIPATPPHLTQLTEINVDRQPLWDRLLELRNSKKRILLVRGERGHGKSQAVRLTREFAEHLGDSHRLLVVDLEPCETVEQFVTLVYAECGRLADIPSREKFSSTPDLWAKTTAGLVFHAVRNLLGDVVPWFVFDHYERMPRSTDKRTFFNELAVKVAEKRNHAFAPRLVLVDYESVPAPAQSAAITQIVQPVTVDEITSWLLRHDAALSPQMAATRAAAIVETVRARNQAALAQTQAPGGTPPIDTFMSHLQVELETML